MTRINNIKSESKALRFFGNRIFVIVLVAFMLESCAASYKPIVLQTLPYPSYSDTRELKMLYQYHVLHTTGNRKYAGKEERSGFSVIAIEITNQTSRPLTFNEDIKLYSDNKQVAILPPDMVRKKIHQVSGLYMLWSLFWVVISSGDGHATPLPIGLGIGLINFGVARASNNAWMSDITRYNIVDKTIKPGETIEGLIGIATPPDEPLTLRLN